MRMIQVQDIVVLNPNMIRTLKIVVSVKTQEETESGKTGLLLLKTDKTSFDELSKQG